MIKYNPRVFLGKKERSLKPPSNISITANHHVVIEISDDIKALLERLNSNIQLIAERLDNSQSDIIREAFIELAAEQKASECIDEPMELSVNIPEPLMEPDKGESPDDWNRVSESSPMSWRVEENGTLSLDYSGSTIENITWAQIRKLLTVEKNKRMPFIKEVEGVGRSNNKKTAISVFCQCVERGLITPPSIDPDYELENNFSQFVQEEDPDAAFKPMLTAYSTLPDPNCGKVEGSLELDA